MYTNEYPDTWMYDNKMPSAPGNSWASSIPDPVDSTGAVRHDQQPETHQAPSSPSAQAKKRRTRRLFIIFSLIAVLALVGGWGASASRAGTTLLQLLPSVHPVANTPMATSPARPMQPAEANSQPTQPVRVPTLPQSLSPQWFATGHTTADAASAAVIAQDFVLRYQSVDGSTPASLAAAQTSPMNFLSRNARLRYLGQMAGSPPDLHDTMAFAQQFHAGITSEQAIAEGSPQVQPLTENGVFFAVVTVPYQMIVTSTGNTQVSHQQMTVLLISVPKNGLSVPNILGWGVTVYTLGTTVPQPPGQP